MVWRGSSSGCGLWASGWVKLEKGRGAKRKGGEENNGRMRERDGRLTAKWM